MACAADHSTRPAVMAPDCEIEGEIADGRHAGGEAGIEPGARRQHAEAIRTDQPQAGRARRFLAGVGERAVAVAEPGCDDDRGRGASFAGRGDDTGHGLRRRRDHDEIGCLRQLLQGPDSFDSLDLRVMRIDRDRSILEARVSQVPQYGAARRRFARASPDDRHRSRREQLVETIGRHRPTRSTENSRAEDSASVGTGIRPHRGCRRSHMAPPGDFARSKGLVSPSRAVSVPSEVKNASRQQAPRDR